MTLSDSAGPKIGGRCR